MPVVLSTLVPSTRLGKGAAALAALVPLYLALRRSSRPSKKASSSALSTTSSAKKGGKAEVNAQFFRRLGKLCRILVPGLFTKESFLLVLQAAFLFSRTLLSVGVARVDGYIVKNLVTGRLRGFLRGIVLWCMIAIPSTLCNSMIKYTGSKISIAFRTRLIDHIHDRYLAGTSFYACGNLDSRIENADQLITQDVSRFCSSLSDLYSNLAKPLLDVALFGTQLTHAVGVAGPLSMCAYYLVTGVMLKAVTPPFGRLAAEEARLEGNFRFCHSRIITNAEEISFYGGAEVEKGIASSAYRDLIRHVNRIYRLRIFHGMAEGLVIKYLSSVQGLFICAIPVFWADRFGGVAGGTADEAAEEGDTDSSLRTQQYIRNRRYLMSLADAVGRLLYSYKEITELAGYTQRVSNMMQTFEDVAEGRYVKTVSVANREALKQFHGGRTELSDAIEFRDVPITTPNGDLLVRSVNFRLEPGMHTVITGPNGCGKSSLFRILGGLWPVLHGTLLKPEQRDLFYVPQRPYLRIGTLRDQVIYPHTAADMFVAGRTDDDLMEILRIAHLDYVVGREGGWDSVKDWKDVLSGGEKQRMGLARLFYHRPKYAILDECTSQVSLDVEGRLYTHATDVGITLLTVSHRPSLWRYHDHLLQFDGNGTVEFSALDAGHRMSLEEERANLAKELKDVPTKQARFHELCGILDVDEEPEEGGGAVEA